MSSTDALSKEGWKSPILICSLFVSAGRSLLVIGILMLNACIVPPSNPMASDLGNVVAGQTRFRKAGWWLYVSNLDHGMLPNHCVVGSCRMARAKPFLSSEISEKVCTAKLLSKSKTRLTSLPIKRTIPFVCWAVNHCRASRRAKKCWASVMIQVLTSNLSSPVTLDSG